MMVQAARGAVQLETDSEQAVSDKTYCLVSEIITQNGIDLDSVVSIQFTQTSDLISLNCAAGLRRYGYDNIPLFCSREPDCTGSMPRVIRTLITFNTEKRMQLQHVYLDGAEKLRPDLKPDERQYNS